MIRFDIVLFDGFDELDALGPWEVLRTATELGAPFEVRLLSLEGRSIVEAAHGLRIALDGEEVTARDPDWVIVPGGGWSAKNQAGAAREIERGALPGRLRDLHARGVSMASVCTGAMLLSAAGLTRGRPVATHAIAKEALRAEGAALTEARVVDDGDLVTAGGVTSGLDLALWLVERLAGSSIADAVATALEHTRTGAILLLPPRRTAGGGARDPTSRLWG